MGDPLGYVQHRPASVTNIDTTSTTFVDVDATNLAVTFEAPLSGTVDIVLHGVVQSVTGAASIYWGLADGSGLVVGTDGLVASSTTPGRVTLRSRVAGLVPAAAYAWTWVHRTSSGANAARLSVGGDIGGAAIEVTAAETTVVEVVLTDLDFYVGMRAALKLRTVDWADPIGFSIYAYGPSFVYSLADTVYADVVAGFVAMSTGALGAFLENRSISDPTPLTFELYANDSLLVNTDDGTFSPIEVSGLVCLFNDVPGTLIWRSHFDAPIILDEGDSILLDWRPNVTG